MRVLCALLAIAISFAVWPTGGVYAADLRTGPAYDCDPRKPRYYGVYEPWSRREERPPRQGMWYYTRPQPPSVNFLIPMAGGLCLRPTPWTPEWFAYCERRWPSFNPKTGTIQTPDGVRMCI